MQKEFKTVISQNKYDMKITELIKGLWRDSRHTPDSREMQEVAQKAKRLAGVYEHRELAGLIRQYRESDEAIESIALAIAKSSPFISPTSTMYQYSIEMMEALKDTRFMDRCGCRLSDIAPEDANIIHGLLAMHTFMLDAALEEYSVNDMERPSHAEVAAARRILDSQRLGQDISELCELASYSMLPSKYVMMRYGLEQVCAIHSFIERYMTDNEEYGIGPEVRRDYMQSEVELCRAAEKAVESIEGVKLPDTYLKKLDDELRNLGRIAASPDSTNDLIHISPYFLLKYGIDKNASTEEQSRLAQKAYRELDDRLVKVTGRRPYADEFLGALHNKEDNRIEKGQSRQEHRHHIRNPPPSKGKGRKPSF